MRYARIPALLALTTALAVTIPAMAQSTSGWGGGSGKSAGHFATVNGIRLYYEDRGSGRPLILLHGGLGAIEMFGPNLPALAAGRRVIAVDLQGHGRTADVDRPIKPELMADDIAALIRHLGLDHPDVMGYSLGGWVALQTAARHPALVHRLVVVSSPFRRDGFYPEILGMQEQVNASMAEAMKPTPMYQLYAGIAPRPEDWPRLLDKMGAAMKANYDYSREIAGIRAPTLIVAGDADIFPPSHAVEFFGLLGGGKRDGGWDGSGRPASRLAILPGLTHYDIFSNPALAEVAIGFLDEPGAGADGEAR
jgi:pimeloyl-ACP methyl ester carboxylesterase